MKTPHICPSWTEYRQNKYRKPMSDVISCKIEENLNGAYDLEMTYPIGGEFSDDINLDAYVSGAWPIVSAVPKKGSKEEPFRIYETVRSLDGLINVKAHHIVYDTDGIVIEPFTATGITAVVSSLNTHWNSYGTEFVVQNNGLTDETTVFEVKEPSSLWSLIGSAASAFGAELSYAYDDFNSRVIITLNANRGSVKTSVIGYGVNIVKAETRTNNEQLYSFAYAYAKNENEDGTVTVVSDYAAYPGLYGRVRGLIVDLSSEFDGLPTQQDLSLAMHRLVSPLSQQQKTASVDFVPLEDTTDGYGESNLSLGDTVTVNAEPIGMNIPAKVVKTVFDPLLEKYDVISVGSVETTIADTIASSLEKAETQNRLIATGIQAMQSVAAGTTSTISVSFGKTFGQPPTVVATLFSSQTTGLGQCSAAVYNITTTGFSLRLTNGYTSDRNLGATWIAM